MTTMAMTTFSVLRQMIAAPQRQINRTNKSIAAALLPPR